MHSPLKRLLFLILLCAAFSLSFGCSHYQSTKNVWKGTKDLWYEYFSPPASIDYSETGSLSEVGQALVDGMMGVDVELTKLERLMSNADRTPSRGWAVQFFTEVPWVDGFAGVRNDGSVLGNIPAPDRTPMELDWVPLLYEPEKQSTRALRATVAPGPNGPEVLVAATLYDGVDFLGIVTCYFSMANVMPHSKTPDSVVVLTPGALLWSKYDYAATPMAGIGWSEVVTKSSSGRVSNETGSFIYQVRWLANLPVIFCVAEKGDFPKSDGSLAGSEKFFPAREQLPVPPVKPRTKNPLEPEGRGHSDLAPGSADSMLLQEEQPAQQGGVEERPLEGENAEYQPAPQPRPQRQRVVRRRAPIVIPDMEEEHYEPAPQIQMPSPFGPRGGDASESESAAESAAETPAAETPAAETPAAESAAPAEETPAAPAETPAAPAETPAEEPAGLGVAPMPTLPGGRPSPFGPRPAPQPEPEPEPAPAAEAYTPPSPFGPRTAPAAATESAPAAAETPAESPAAPAETPAAAQP